MRTSGSRICCALVLLMAATTFAAEEPNAQIASTWWPDLPNVVTPVAWRDHPHRFCIVYDGTIFALPDSQKLLRFEWDKGKPLEGVQLFFTPSSDGTIVPLPPSTDLSKWLPPPEGPRVGDQGWDRDHAAPVLWTRWKTNGGELRQRVFAHMTGGGEAKTGGEPMFAWIRLEAKNATSGFLVRITSPHMRFEMSEGDNCRLLPGAAKYPKPLKRDGGHVVDGDGDVRVAIVGGKASFKDGAYVHIVLAAGEHADLLLPMIPAKPDAIRQELAFGFDAALAQADKFWNDRPSTAATIHTPEPLINDAIADSVRIARMLTTMVPQTKQRSLLSGAMQYSYLWVTPTSMTKFMLLDPLGRHEEVAKYLEIYRQEQGRVKAPGPDYKPHPGYFGPPAALDSGNLWLSDHGAVLYAASRHALLTGDEEFIEHWRDPILKACDFIKEARRLPRAAEAAPGVLPPGSSTDISRPIQAVSSDALNYKALVTAARLLRVLNHPRAGEFETESAEYREAIVRAWREKAARQPKWTDSSGRQRVIVPMTLSKDVADGLGHEHPFYLDAGPLIGVYAGILPADDPLMRDAIDFFREGPHAKREGTPRWNDPPRLIHEMSSAEPCYSWNVFHSHQLADREHFLEGMYSLFTGALARTTHVSCETRGGITENVFASTTAVELARLAVIDDELEPGSLHLMRLTPLAWVSKDEQTRFENMPTEFGPVTLKWQLADDGGVLRIEYAGEFRRPPTAVLLHVPPMSQPIKVIVNGKEHAIRSGEPIKLSQQASRRITP